MIIWVYDRWGNQTGVIGDFIDFVHDDEIGALDFIEFAHIGDSLTKGNYLLWRDEFGLWHEHIVRSAEVTHNLGSICQHIYAVNSISELTLSYINEKNSYNLSNSAAWSRLLEDTRWTIGRIDNLGLNDIKFYHTTVYDGVTGIIDKWGGELSTTITVGTKGVLERRVNHQAKRGEDNNLLFTYGFDMQNVIRTIDLDDVYTKIHVFGKGEPTFGDDGDQTGNGRRITFADINDGKDYVENTDAMQRWGVIGKDGAKQHAEGSFIFESCEDPEELLELAKAKLAEVSEPRITYSADVVTLAQAGMNFKNARAGDTCYLRDKELGERLKGRIIHVRRYINSSMPTEITLGNVVRNITDNVKDQQKQLDRLNQQASSWDSMADVSSPWLDLFIDELNSQMNVSGGYVYMDKGEGITVYDRPRENDPTMAIQLKGAGFRIANSKKSNGEWDWRTFGTGDGFTADLINVGVLRCGDNIIDLNSGTFTLRNGIIQDLNSLNYINLGTGECRLASTATVGGKSIPSIAEEAAQASLSNFVNSVYDPKVAELQAQIDGQIETWFFDYAPTLTNKPASDWNTDAKKAAHEGDLFFNRATGYAYRFFKDSDSWKWQLIKDNDITLALEEASKAQDTADSKRRVFVSTPAPPYEIGDLWVQGTSGDLMRCQVNRASGSYVTSDWIKATKYTDDSGLNAFITGEYANDLKELENQLDGKAETWYQTGDPSTAWSTSEEQSEHKGDLWCNPNDGITRRWSGTAWVEMTTNPPKGVFDEIDGKAQIFISQPKPPYYEGDLYFQSETSDILTCIKDRETGNYTVSDWQKRNKYIDQSAANEAASSAVKAQTQKDIFDKLTDNGNVQGLYMQDGNLYFNGTYIAAGRVADKTGKTYFDLENGEIKILDNYGNTIILSPTEGMKIYDSEGRWLAGTLVEDGRCQFYTRRVGVSSAQYIQMGSSTDPNYAAFEYTNNNVVVMRTVPVASSGTRSGFRCSFDTVSTKEIDWVQGTKNPSTGEETLRFFAGDAQLVFTESNLRATVIQGNVSRTVTLV